MQAVIDLLAAKANCDLFISVNYLLPPAALLRQPNGAVRVCCVVLRCAVLFLCCCCALSCCIVVCCCCVVLCCVVTYFAVLSHILLLGVCEFLALLRQPNGAVRVCCVVLRCAVRRTRHAKAGIDGVDTFIKNYESPIPNRLRAAVERYVQKFGLTAQADEIPFM